MSDPQPLTPEEKFADAKKQLGLPPIVALCGSIRFMNEMTEAELRETTARPAKIVVKPVVEATAQKAQLDELHRARILLADEVLVVGDYIGDSTRDEIVYARSLGKHVRFTHPEVDPDT